jgi:hypothetical protein
MGPCYSTGLNIFFFIKKIFRCLNSILKIEKNFTIEVKINQKSEDEIEKKIINYKLELNDEIKNE